MSSIDKLFDNTVPALQKAMDLTWRRNEALVSNIANIETPMYRATDLDFGGELDRAFKMNNMQLKMTHSKHVDVGGPKGAHLVADLSGATRGDGTNVDIDIQMGKMVVNRGKYSASAALVRKKLHMLRMAIRMANR